MKNTNTGYAVIGGQYGAYCYNKTPIKTLRGAKMCASKNMEYHDNWQGWTYPAVYRWEDTECVADRYNAGCTTRQPRAWAEPVATREHGEHWVTEK